MKLKFVFFLFAFFATSAIYATKIIVVTTTADLKSILNWSAKDKVDVSSIATGYQNPHFVDPKTQLYYQTFKSRYVCYCWIRFRDRLVTTTPLKFTQFENSKGDQRLCGCLCWCYFDASAFKHQSWRRRYPHLWKSTLLVRSVNGKQIAKNICDGLEKISPEK